MGLIPDQWVKQILARGEATAAALREPNTHDWRSRQYALTTHDEGRTIALVCWSDFPHGPLPGVGDYLILRNGDGSTRYQVDRVESALAEGDVHAVRCTFAPRINDDGETP